MAHWKFAFLFLVSLGTTTFAEHAVLREHSRSRPRLGESAEGQTTRTSFAEVVKVLSEKGGLCSGTMVSPRVIITAAHCLPDSPHATSARIGFAEAGAPQRASRCFAHPDFRGGAPYNDAMKRVDIAVCILPRAVASPYACLGRRLARGDRSYLIGYGRSNEGATPTSVNDGRQRAGRAEVARNQHGLIDSVTDGPRAFLMPGDSGGFTGTYTPGGDPRLTLRGVNIASSASVGANGVRLEGRSVSLDLSSVTVRTFLTNVEDAERVDVCDLERTNQRDALHHSFLINRNDLTNPVDLGAPPGATVSRLSTLSHEYAEGLRQGDRIVGINRDAVGDVSQLEIAMRQARFLPCYVHVMRGTRTVTLFMTPLQRAYGLTN